MTVRDIIAAHAPRLRSPEFANDDDIVLGAEGLGLDSIAIAEALLDCERRFEVRLADLLDGAPITVSRIVTAVAERRNRLVAS
jgi:acyl carrier protein